MSGLAIAVPILVDIAKKVGAPFVKKILEEEIGGTAGKLGGKIIDAIAMEADVAPIELPDVPEADLEKAVLAVEAEAPELVSAWNRQQELSNELQLAEMKQGEATWTWAWRPAWMWFLMFLWLWRFVLIPVVDAMLGSTIALAVDITILMGLTGLFTALYMGGHTVLKGVEKWKGSQQ